MSVWKQYLKALTVDLFLAATVDCQVSVWSDWSSCSASGYQSRFRSVAAEPRHGGTPCPTLQETRTGPCSTTEAPWPPFWPGYHLDPFSPPPEPILPASPPRDVCTDMAFDPGCDSWQQEGYCSFKYQSGSNGWDLFMVSDRDSNTGKILAYVGDRWGTVCDDGWSNANAKVTHTVREHKPNLATAKQLCAILQTKTMKPCFSGFWYSKSHQFCKSLTVRLAYDKNTMTEWNCLGSGTFKIGVTWACHTCVHFQVFWVSCLSRDAVSKAPWKCQHHIDMNVHACMPPDRWPADSLTSRGNGRTGAQSAALMKNLPSPLSWMTYSAAVTRAGCRTARLQVPIIVTTMRMLRLYVPIRAFAKPSLLLTKSH
eukprot:363900-Chlamydomonas_euryale.AAC.7